jgi:hypothetical protein
LSDKEVKEIIICAALKMNFTTKDYFRINLSDAQKNGFEDQFKLSCISEFVINDHFLASFIHFLSLEDISTTLIAVRGNRPKKSSNSQEIKQLARYLSKEIPSFSFNQSKLSQAKFKTFTTTTVEPQMMFI